MGSDKGIRPAFRPVFQQTVRQIFKPASRPAFSQVLGRASQQASSPLRWVRQWVRQWVRLRSGWFALALALVLWSSLGGGALAQLTGPPPGLGDSGLDAVPDRLQVGQQLYLENCATCHLGIPVALLPLESWRYILQDASHYGTRINPPQGPSQRSIWQYMQAFARGKSNREERTPYRLKDSQYFKALHPKVTLPRPLALDSCITCHPGIPQGNWRQLNVAALGKAAALGKVADQAG